MQFDLKEAYDEACRQIGDLSVKNTLVTKFVDELMVPGPEAQAEATEPPQ